MIIDIFLLIQVALEEMLESFQMTWRDIVDILKTSRSFLKMFISDILKKSSANKILHF